MSPFFPTESTHPHQLSADDGIDLSALELVFDYLASRASHELQACSIQVLTHTLHEIQKAEALLIARGLSRKQAKAAILTEGARTISELLQAGSQGS